MLGDLIFHSQKVVCASAFASDKCICGDFGDTSEWTLPEADGKLTLAELTDVGDGGVATTSPFTAGEAGQ